MLDIPSKGEIAELIANAMTRREDKHYHTEVGSFQTNASGVGTTTLHAPRLFGWLCERITVTTNPPAAALIGFYENDQNVGSNLREIIQLGTLGLYSDGFDNRMYIPPGSLVIITCASGPVSGSVTYNMQIELIEAQNG